MGIGHHPILRQGSGIRQGLTGLAISAESAHNGKMSKDRDATLRVEVKVREKPPNPFKWEIYRGNEPMWIERAMHGYATERDAYDAGQAALTRLLNYEALNKSKP